MIDVMARKAPATIYRLWRDQEDAARWTRNMTERGFTPVVIPGPAFATSDGGAAGPMMGLLVDLSSISRRSPALPSTGPATPHGVSRAIARAIVDARAEGREPTSIGMGSALADALTDAGVLPRAWRPMLRGLPVVVEEDGGAWWALRFRGDPEPMAVACETRPREAVRAA